MSLERAAAAFDADMGNTKSMSNLDRSDDTGPAAEPIFTSLGDLEVDDDSPARGGGDETLTPEEMREAAKARRTEKKTKKKDEEDPYEGFSDEELEALGMPPRDPDEEEDEDPDGEHEEDADEGDDDDDEMLSTKFTVMVDGEEQQVSLKEALRGYSHRKAVDQRMNFVNQATQEVTELANAVVGMRADVDAKLAEAEEILKALLPTEPNWDELFTKDPVAARNLQKQYEGFQAKLKEIQDKRKENGTNARRDDMTNTVTYRNREAKKFAAFAKWDSAKSRDKDIASMQRTASTLGFSNEEIAQVMDSRMLAVLLKASKYDRMMAAKPRPANVRQQQRSANPGTPRGKRTAPKGNDRAMKHLQRTGSLDAAASVFEGILKRS